MKNSNPSYIPLFGGIACLVLAALLSALGPGEYFQSFLQSYLFAFLFWVGLSLGAFSFLCLHDLTEGKWGNLIHPRLEASSNCLLPFGVLIIPIFIGVKALYPWAAASGPIVPPELSHKATYLNATAFTLRTVLYFALWGCLQRYRKQIGAGAALVIYFLSVSFAAIDWVMSLDPFWYSTIYGMLVIISFGLEAMAFSVFMLARDVALAKPYAPQVGNNQKRDLGNILLALVMVWAYLSFMQYLVIWQGNLPEEVTWAIERSSHGWQWLVLSLASFQLAAPLLLLLFRKVKDHPRLLSLTAFLILFMRVIDMYWFVIPSFHRRSAIPHATDLFCFVGLGGIWLALYFSFLTSKMRRAHATA